MRRALLLALAAAAAAGVAGCGPAAPGEGSAPAAAPAAEVAAAPAIAPRRGDVVLVTIDTLRADAVGFAGNRRVATPVLDRLAAAGRVFTDAHAHNVVTLPSHANILTGRYPFDHGVRDNAGFVLPSSVPTLASLLRAAGWATGAFVGAFPLDSRFGLDRGFEVYDDAYPRGADPAAFVIAERPGDAVVRAALAWWRAQAGRPRFLWVHLYEPHAAYEPPLPFAERYRDAPYLGEVAAADSFLQPLLDPVLDGRERPAIVVVTADHGEALGEHGELTHGLFAYEATLAVPLVVWAPGLQPGRDARPAAHVDVLPTVLAAVGVAAPSGLPGRSLLQPPPAAVPDLYFESLTTALNRGWAPLRGVLRGRHKLIDLPLPELYDLDADPGEARNLADRDRRQARELRAALPAASAWPPPGRGAVAAETAARLRSLGYVVGAAGAKTAHTAADDPKSLIGLDRELHRSIDLYSRGRYEEAAAAARRAIDQRPDMAEGYERLGSALRQLERHDEAIAALRDGLRRADQPSLRRQLGLALAEAGRAPDAVAVLEPLAPAGEPETLRALGVALSDAGRHAEAIALLERAAAADAGDPKVHEDLGIVALRLDRPAAARDHLRRALALNEALPISWNTLGVALYRLQDPPGAVAAWRRAVALDPQQYDALYNLGLVAAESGRGGEARQALERFVATAPPARFAAEIARARQLLARLPG